MQVTVQMITGDTIVSDSISLDAFRAEIGGTESHFQKTMALIVDVIQSPAQASSMSVTVNGRQRSLNPNHILWTEIDMEGETFPEVDEQAEREAQRQALRRPVRY